MASATDSWTSSWLTRSTIYDQHEARRLQTMQNRDDPRPAVARILAGLPGFRVYRYIPPAAAVANSSSQPTSETEASNQLLRDEQSMSATSASCALSFPDDATRVSFHDATTYAGASTPTPVLAKEFPLGSLAALSMVMVGLAAFHATDKARYRYASSSTVLAPRTNLVLFHPSPFQNPFVAATSTATHHHYYDVAQQLLRNSRGTITTSHQRGGAPLRWPPFTASSLLLARRASVLFLGYAALQSLSSTDRN